MSQDEFDGARSGFVKQEDLEGRLLLIKPFELGERVSTGQYAGTNADGTPKSYEYAVTTTVVLDGEPGDLIDEVPFLLEDYQFAGLRLVAQLKPKIRTGRQVLGRLTRVPVKGRTDAWELAEPAEADKVVARAYLASVPKDDVFA
jgi:hypothetical protein